MGNMVSLDVGKIGGPLGVSFPGVYSSSVVQEGCGQFSKDQHITNY